MVETDVKLRLRLRPCPGVAWAFAVADDAGVDVGVTVFLIQL